MKEIYILPALFMASWTIVSFPLAVWEGSVAGWLAATTMFWSIVFGTVFCFDVAHLAYNGIHSLLDSAFETDRMHDSPNPYQSPSSF